MELRRLEHLVAVAETANFHKAAERCNITQSALSRSVQAAEEEYGVQLFDRGTTRVTCTEAGKLAVERARKVLFEDRCLARDMKMYRERLLGDLSIGVGPYPAAVIIPRMVVALRTSLPQVKIMVEVSSADRLSTRLRAEELDFFMADVRLLESAPDLLVQRVGKLVAGFYVRADHPLSHVESLEPAMLLPFGMGSVRAPMAIRLALGAAMGLPTGQAMPLMLECDDLSLLKKIARQTDTIIVCPDADAQQEVSAGHLVKLKLLKLEDPYADFAIVSLKGRSFSPAAIFALNAIRQSAAQAQGEQSVGH